VHAAPIAKGWILLATVVFSVPWCNGCNINRNSDSATHYPNRPPPAELEPVAVRTTPPGANEHRIVLDQHALEQLRNSAKRGSSAWHAVLAGCEEASKASVSSGYQGFVWADAVANLALCYHATSRQSYAKMAAVYLTALLNDRFEVGDGKGGASVVTHDSGYGIRTFAAYSALGYDWLRGTPGMTPELRARVLERLGEWLAWYSQKGYLKDKPTANYYWGYLTALSFAGISFAGEAPAADAWITQARRELEQHVLPTFQADLKGGGWPEGWQYGEYTAAEVALVAQVFRANALLDVPAKMPWLADNVAHHLHALLPDEQSVYDGGTWGEHPAKPSALALSAASIALEGIDDPHASEARFLIAHSLPRLSREQAFIGLLSDRTEAPLRDPRKTAATSLHLVGQGLSFMRSDWTKSAVWASFQAGPWLTPDHQDKDQGHFELWRGSDGLLVDGGDSEGSATINHNTLLIDDGGRVITYSPNQGVWGKHVQTARFADDGAVVVAVGDIGEAYAPQCADEGCKQRSVNQFSRTLVYVRPSLLVIDDRVLVDRPEVGVTWAAHLTTNPKITGILTSAVVGASRVDIHMLEPDATSAQAFREPTPTGEGPHRADHPWGPMWRIEVKSPTGARARRFLSFITVDSAGAESTAATHVTGEGLEGAFGRADKRSTAILFASASGTGSIALDGAALVVIVGLKPGQRYRVKTTPENGCIRQVALSRDGDLTATSGGFIRVLAPNGCT
jgi:hypothetical protein